MERYRNLSGDSGVTAFKLLPDGIEVEFVNGSVYRYTVDVAGSRHIAAMKKRALAGHGLSTWISQEDPPYTKRIR